MGSISKKIAVAKKRIIVEQEGSRIQFTCVCMIFAVISFVMSIFNCLGHRWGLTYVTLLFLLLNLLNITFTHIRNDALFLIAKILFCTETILLFSYFVISGKPEGFSAIWVALLPLVMLLLFKKKYGSIVSLIMFIILIVLFWTNAGNCFEGIKTSYTATFKLRFPFLYLAFYFVGLFFESVRAYTQSELIKARDNYLKLSLTDALTGLGNETAYLRSVVRKEKQIENKTAKFALTILDLNGLKETNDTYGHRFGCSLIVTTGKLLPSIFPDSEVFHIGGDEFAIISEGNDYEHIKERLETCKQKLEYTTSQLDNIALVLSVAVGNAVYKNGETYTDTFQRADNNMYKNKKEIKQKYNMINR